jgi:hypothetical protein
VILDAKAGILNGIERRCIASDAVAPDKECGRGAGIFEVVYQRGRIAGGTVIKAEINRTSFQAATESEQAHKK